MNYMGIDHHKQYFIATVMDQQGRKIKKDSLSTDRVSIVGYLQKAGELGNFKEVIEAGYGWDYMYRVFYRHG